MIKNIVFGTAVRVGKNMAESIHNYDENGNPRRFFAQFSSRVSGSLEMPVVQIVDNTGELPTVETSTANVKYWVIQPTTKQATAHDEIPWPSIDSTDQPWTEEAPKKKGKQAKKVTND